eukprot:jgi/Hompol1/6810/HPOL_005103-RA
MISSQQLMELLRNLNQSVLLLDVRPVSEFRSGHIAWKRPRDVNSVRRGGVVNLQPECPFDSMTLLESSKLFDARATFDYIVVYDAASLSLFQSPALSMLIQILFNNDQERGIKSATMMLRGGFNSWASFSSADSSPRDWIQSGDGCAAPKVPSPQRVGSPVSVKPQRQPPPLSKYAIHASQSPVSPPSPLNFSDSPRDSTSRFNNPFSAFQSAFSQPPVPLRRTSSRASTDSITRAIDAYPTIDPRPVFADAASYPAVKYPSAKDHEDQKYGDIDAQLAEFSMNFPELPTMPEPVPLPVSAPTSSPSYMATPGLVPVIPPKPSALIPVASLVQPKLASAAGSRAPTPPSAPAKPAALSTHQQAPPPPPPSAKPVELRTPPASSPLPQPSLMPQPPRGPAAHPMLMSEQFPPPPPVLTRRSSSPSPSPNTQRFYLPMTTNGDYTAPIASLTAAHPGQITVMPPKPIRQTSLSTLKAFAQEPSQIPILQLGSANLGIAGLKNIGNTCFLNSVVQCLSATVPFARFFLDGSYRRFINRNNPMSSKGRMAESFAQLIQAIWKSQDTVVVPSEFKETVNDLHPSFAGNEQHDSQEFLAALLDSLHEDFNIARQGPDPKPKPQQLIEADTEGIPDNALLEREWELYKKRNWSIIVDMFQGILKSSLRCLVCGKTSTTFNPFMYLSLPIPSHDRNGNKGGPVLLDDCLRLFVAEEILDGDDAWMCPRCKVKRRATKRLTIAKLPYILLVHLKRFSYQGPFRDKVETYVHFQTNSLNLTHYMTPKLPEPGMATAPLETFSYDLFAISSHFGGVNGGHYTAQVRNSYRQQWLNFDDSRITVLDETKVKVSFDLALPFRLMPNSYCFEIALTTWHTLFTRCALRAQTPAAYILFYNRSDGGASMTNNWWSNRM